MGECLDCEALWAKALETGWREARLMYPPNDSRLESEALRIANQQYGYYIGRY
jgi:hypothetical protein